MCVCLTAPIPVDHAADSKADVRGGGCCDCYSVLCLGADIYHIGLWEQKNKLIYLLISNVTCYFPIISLLKPKCIFV